jgi:hypothetical protein
MSALDHAQMPSPLHLLLAREPEAPWASRAFDEVVPPATLRDARARRDELRTLLGRERAAAADFLLALADFDRRRGWERLGHASLFAFLTRELGLSAGAAQLRLSAARLLPRHPDVEAALRDGRLCMSAVGQLARVLTVENEAAVLPRFFGRSSREAQEVAAAILPAPVPLRGQVITMVRAPAAPASLPLTLASGAASAPPSAAPPGAEPLHAHEVAARNCATQATRQVIALTADLRRLHLTVTAGFLERVGQARTGLSHALPGATTEQVLEAALEALLEKQAGRKGLGKRAVRKATAAGASSPLALPCLDRPDVPAALERAVRLRDGDRCQFPLDAGGVCGSTWQVELDHLVPVALGGETSLANLRCLCRRHNQAAAREALGPAADSRRPKR